MTAAAARAAHLVVDQPPVVFVDAHAVRLLGDQAAELLSYHREHGDNPILAAARAEVLSRSRYTESVVAAAHGAGVDQYVLLGAGLDTFSLRAPATLRVFEVDHPATQSWKRERLTDENLSPAVTYVPFDLGTGDVLDHLATAGFLPAAPAVVGCLGVSTYLAPTTVEAMVADLARLAPGSEVVTEFLLPERDRDEIGSLYARVVGEVAAHEGEPWRTFLSTDNAVELFRRNGFADVTAIAHRDCLEPHLWERTDALRPVRLSYLVHARR